MPEFKLTEEGREYLEKGLPEKNLVEALKQGPLKLEEARKKVKNLAIALQWAKKKNWVKIEKDVLSLIKYPEKIPEEEALRKIHEGKEVEENILKILIERKLVWKITEVYKKTEEALRKAGNVVGELTHDIILTGLWKNRKFSPVDVEVVKKKLDLTKIKAGKPQPYNYFLTQVRKKLAELGFKEMTGPMIETEFWNFDALFQPQNHPARDWAMTYQIKQPKFGKLPDKKIVENVKKAHEVGIAGSTGWQYKWDPKIAMQLVPRAHTTCLSARTLANKPEIPGKYFALLRCFRPDIIDAMHGVEFNQVEGIVVGTELTFKSLLGILKTFAKEIAGAEQVKFYPDYYPFTEPSAQLSAKHPELGWIEFGGSGIFREELTKPLGINVPVLAWGLGIDRLAMFKLKINDIRELFSRNLKWLRSR
jgi:phenylalanyl-tRNA synthetase alpha chain